MDQECSHDMAKCIARGIGAQLVKRGKRRGFLVKSGEQASLHKERHAAGEQRVVDVTMTRGAPEVLFLVF